MRFSNLPKITDVVSGKTRTPKHLTLELALVDLHITMNLRGKSRREVKADRLKMTEPI